VIICCYKVLLKPEQIRTNQVRADFRTDHEHIFEKPFLNRTDHLFFPSNPNRTDHSRFSGQNFQTEPITKTCSGAESALPTPAWYIEILDSDGFKFRPIKIDLQNQNLKKNSEIRNQRKILRIMYNLRFSVPQNLHDLAHFFSTSVFLPFIHSETAIRYQSVRNSKQSTGAKIINIF
jgi:hypothetical protein